MEYIFLILSIIQKNENERKKERKMMELKDMIYKGLCDGTVELINSPCDDEIVCKIGEYWFYFIPNECYGSTPEEVFETYTKEELTDMILNQLHEFEEDNDFNDEFLYYKYFLEEHFGISEEPKEDDLKTYISQGLDNDYVKIITNVDGFIMCQIGDKQFFFIGEDYEEVPPKAIPELFTKEELVDMIFDAFQKNQGNSEFEKMRKELVNPISEETWKDLQMVKNGLLNLKWDCMYSNRQTSSQLKQEIEKIRILLQEIDHIWENQNNLPELLFPKTLEELKTRFDTTEKCLTFEKELKLRNEDGLIYLNGTLEEDAKYYGEIIRESEEYDGVGDNHNYLFIKILDLYASEESPLVHKFKFMIERLYEENEFITIHDTIEETIEEYKKALDTLKEKLEKK